MVIPWIREEIHIPYIVASRPLSATLLHLSSRRWLRRRGGGGRGARGARGARGGRGAGVALEVGRWPLCRCAGPSQSPRFHVAVILSSVAELSKNTSETHHFAESEY